MIHRLIRLQTVTRVNLAGREDKGRRGEKQYHEGSRITHFSGLNVSSSGLVVVSYYVTVEIIAGSIHKVNA